MDKIRWGILSTGNIAHSFATGLQSAQDAELVAVGSRNQDNADKFAEEFDIPHAHGSYEALVNDADVDVIYIGTPHVFHAENTLLCLNAGKHVLCEKPFTVNASEAEECIRVAKEKNLFLMEAIWMRFLPSIIKLQELIQDGVIGDVTLIKADFSFNFPFLPEHRLLNRELGGGALLDVGIYPISFTTLLLGKPNKVDSHAIIGETGVDEQCTMLFHYDNASALLSGGVNGNMKNEAVVKGTKGIITVHAPFFVSQKLTVQIYGEDEEVIDLPLTGNGYNYEAEAVHSAISAGKIEHDVIPHEETMTTMNLMDALRHDWGLVYPQES